MKTIKESLLARKTQLERELAQLQLQKKGVEKKIESVQLRLTFANEILNARGPRPKKAPHATSK